MGIVANSVDPYLTAPLGSSQIRVYSVCSDLYVQNLEVIRYATASLMPFKE